MNRVKYENELRVFLVKLPARCTKIAIYVVRDAAKDRGDKNSAFILQLTPQVRSRV